MRLHPGADRLHRQLLARDLTALDQQPADGHVRLAVAAVIADAQDAAFLQPHPPRTLDLQKERVDRVVDPDQLQSLPVKRAVLDLAAAEAFRIAWAPVERRLKRAAALARAVERDLVIAGEEPFGGAVIPGEERDEAGLEEPPRCVVIARRQICRAGAGFPPIGN